MKNFSCVLESKRGEKAGTIVKNYIRSYISNLNNIIKMNNAFCVENLVNYLLNTDGKGITIYLANENGGKNWQVPRGKLPHHMILNSGTVVVL